MGTDTKAALARIARLSRRSLAPAAVAGWPDLIVMTDRERQGEAAALLDAMPRGTALCLRDYDMPGRAAYAARLSARARARGIRFLVGADARLALSVGAWGVHMPEGLWRLRRGEIAAAKRRGLKVTTAVHSETAAQHAIADAAGQRCDAVIISPVFATASHPGAKTLGPIGFQKIARGLPVPAYALGGIAPGTIRRLAGTCAAGIAGIGVTGR